MWREAVEGQKGKGKTHGRENIGANKSKRKLKYGIEMHDARRRHKGDKGKRGKRREDVRRWNIVHKTCLQIPRKPVENHMTFMAPPLIGSILVGLHLDSAKQRLSGIGIV
jgi:hypothetical protein